MFYSKEELMAMPLKKLRLIDVYDKEKEALLQEVISLKEEKIIPDVPIKKSDIPDIKTPEEEKGWQKVIDLRVEAVKVKTPGPVTTFDKEGTIIDPLKCKKCDFKAKSKIGLIAHSRKHNAKA
jgi:hypothetical protein